MKKLILLLLFSPVYLFGNSRFQDNISPQAINLSDSTSVFTRGPAKADAERILGQAAQLTEDKKETSDNRIKRSLSYTALDKEEGTHRPINLHYTLTKYPDSVLARRAYNDILKSNTNLPGQSSLTGIGDEAWYHSDSENFSVIIVRKSDMLMLMKPA